ncbi:MAG: isoaspartyl peptidase/L-asparaginase [Halobacteriales archaeon]
MRIIVHGGAGGAPDDPESRTETLSRAARRGASEETPLDAVEAAVRELESASRFNAGRGGAVQSDGVVRTDAGVMRSDRTTGAACGMAGVQHAASVARVVAEETPHVLLAGDPAVDLAESAGIETDLDLLTERTRTRFGEASPPGDAGRDALGWVRERFGTDDDGDETDDDGEDDVSETDHDTVGAVAHDGETLAAATSTGGRWFALAGRVGDVPQVGAGFYASPAGAASATGHGEEIAEFGLARRVVSLIADGRDASAAVTRAIEEFEAGTGATAGVIAIDSGGGIGEAHNAEAMGTGTDETG